MEEEKVLEAIYGCQNIVNDLVTLAEDKAKKAALKKRANDLKAEVEHLLRALEG